MSHLADEDDRAVFDDKGYVGNQFKPSNHRMSSNYARVEHVCRVIKRQFGYTKVRYRRIAKNAAQEFSLIGRSNLYSRRSLIS